MQSSDRAYARLWDDPFAVFPQDKNPPHDGDPFSLPDKAPTLLAFVLLDGLGYAEDNEFRLRSRFAVQKALADLDYFPENPEVLESLPYPSDLRSKTTDCPVAPDLRQIEDEEHMAFGNTAANGVVRLFYIDPATSHQDPIARNSLLTRTAKRNGSAGEDPYLSTQLDSRYLAVENLSFTRNLIVASPFGLSPLDDNNRKSTRFVSFRDSNQTSLYAAVRSAVLGTETPKSGAGVYEIGNVRAVRMNDAGSAENAGWVQHESLLDGTNPIPEFY